MIEIYYILKENAIILRRNKGPSHSKDMLLCEPGEVHGVDNDTDEDFQIVVFKINTKDDDMVWIK